MSMTILLWLTLGLMVGVVARRLPRASESRIQAEVALGLFASIVGGLIALYVH
jgi:uncharacterized membrane protein YeaQ/YmgE (transglycosylase-associated protein family)